MIKRTFSAVAVFVLVGLIASCGGGGDEKGGAPRARAFPVQVETVVGRDIQYTVSAVGSVEAFESVLITARVRGVVDNINFREGQSVTRETVLAEIDVERFKHAYDAAFAAHQRAEAELKDAQEGLRRRENPGERPGIFSREEIEAWKTRVAVAQANEREKAADLEQARLNKRDSRPSSPMDGVIQSRLVQTGQWVEPGTVMARLLRRDPMLVRFAVTEGQASQLQQGQEATFAATGERRQYRASITHVAASADAASRMVQVIGEVHKEDAPLLTPGTFIRVSIPVGSSKASPTVPETAVRPSERGFLVYVVEGDQAFQRVIELGLRTQDGRVEVRAGLENGEVVVVRGAEALRQGATVRVVSPGEGATRPAEVARQ